MSKPIEVGSRVCLNHDRQGEIEMTVVAIGEVAGDKDEMVPAARCFWFDTDHKLQDGLFPFAALLVGR